MLKILYVVFLLNICCSITWAQNKQDTVVFSDNNFKSLSPFSLFLEDKTAGLTLQQILSDSIQQKFFGSDQEVFNSPASRSAFWVKLIVKNETGEDIWLDSGGPLSNWYIDFYRPDSTGNYGSPVETGSFRPMENKEYPTNLFRLKLAGENETKTRIYYIRFAGQQNKEFILKAGTLRALEENQRKFDLLNAAFIGWMVSIILYNLFLGVATKDRIYFIYLGYLIPSLINICYISHYPFSDAIWLREYHYVWFSTNFLFAFYFTRVYLQLSKTAPILDKVIIGLTLACVSFSVLNLFGVPVVSLVNSFQDLSAVCGLILLWPGIYLWIKGDRRGAIYTVGWSFLIISNIIYVGTTQGYLPSTFVSRNVFHFGVAIEVLVFSLALADRLNTLRKEKEEAQLKNIELIRQQNIILEQKVSERTEEIQKKTQAIQVQAHDLAELNATKDKLFSIIGHDLRGPVGSLKDILDMAGLEQISPEELKKLTPLLQRNASNLYETLDNLLQWSYSQMKGMTSMPKSMNVSEIIGNNIELLSDLAATKSISIEQITSENDFIFADTDQVNIILRNLISNAIKFTPDGGKIIISSKKKGDSIEICVSDSGVGMSREHLNKLFKVNTDVRTFGTNGESGTGLGLLLCKEMVEINQGKISVSSKEGKGSEFTVSLPEA